MTISDFQRMPVVPDLEELPNVVISEMFLARSCQLLRLFFLPYIVKIKTFVCPLFSTLQAKGCPVDYLDKYDVKTPCEACLWSRKSSLQTDVIQPGWSHVMLLMYIA